METRVMSVSPKAAKELLDTANSTNRTLRASWVRVLASRMEEGEWKVTHQGIALSKSGRLLDGQHRLAAIVQYGKPIRIQVSTGLPEEYFDALDGGIKRSMGDILGGTGIAHSVLVSAIARLVTAYDEMPDTAWTGFEFQKVTSSSHKILGIVSQTPDEYQEACHNSYRIQRELHLTPSASGAASFLIAREERDGGKARTQFIDGLITGENLSAGDPRLAVRKMFLITRTDKRTSTKQYQVSILIKAWNAFIEGRDIFLLKFKTDEKMPQVKPAPRHSSSKWITETVKVAS